MMKKLVILLACMGLAFQITSCTSKDSKAESEVAADVDSADLEKIEGDTAASNDNSLSSDQLPEDALGETTTTTQTTTTTTDTSPIDDHASTTKTDVATNTETLPADPLAENPANMTPPPPAEPSTTIVDAAPPGVDNTTMVESTTKTETSTTVVDSGPKKPSAPLQKMATAPWKVGKTWFNTVYFARPGDSLASISQMIYGADKTAELKKGNTVFKSRKVRPGDKVYYSSPHRSDDSEKMLTYYEDNGIAPEVYVAKAGDDLKKVSKNLLGYDGAWKEVWASNSIESKGKMDEGAELRYWKTSPAAAAAPVHKEVVSSAPHAQEEVPHQAMQEPQAPAMPPPPTSDDMAPPPQVQAPAQGEIPPPPMPDQQQQQAGTEMPPPPPPPVEQAPPPPPPPVQAVNPPAPPHEDHVAATEEGAPNGMDQDTTMALAVVGLAAAGLAILIVLRKKRKQRDLEQQAMDNTHVGT